MRHLGRKTAFNLGGIVVQLVVGFGLSILLARSWPRELFETYVLSVFVAQTLSMIAAAAFPAAAVRLVAEARGAGDHARASAVLWAILGRVAILAATVAAIAVAVERSFGLLAVGSTLGAVVLLAMAQSIASVLGHGAQGADRFDLFFRTTSLATLAAGALAATAAALGSGPALVIALVASGQVGLALGLGLGLARALPGRGEADAGAALRSARPYFWTVTGLVLVDQVVWQRSELFFLRHLGGAGDIAFYNVAFQLASTFVRMLPAAIAGALIPGFAHLAGSGDGVQLAPHYRRAVAVMASTTAVLSVFAIGLRNTLVLPWGFADAAPLVPILVLGLATGNVSGTASILFHGFGRAGELLRAGLVLAIANLALDVLLIPSLGATGAALACAGAQLVSLPLIGYLLWRALGLTPPWAVLGRLLGATACALGAGVLGASVLGHGVLGELAATALALATGATIWLALAGAHDLRPPAEVIDPPAATGPAPPVSVIVPTKNRPDYLRETLDRILAEPGPERETIVVDSSDDERTQALLAERYPQIRAVRVKHYPNNRHFAKNQGIRLARGELLCHLDDDSRVEPGWLARTLAHYDDPRVGGTGGRIIDDHFGAAADDPRIGRINPNGRIALNFTEDPGRVIDVDHVIGCNMSFRAAALAAVGGFDESYGGPNFMEETDLCLRVRSAGYRILFDPEAVVSHASAPREEGFDRDRPLDPQTVFWSARSRSYFALKQLPRTVAVLRYCVLGFIKLHLQQAVRQRSLEELGAALLQVLGSSLGLADWLAARLPRAPLRLAQDQASPASGTAAGGGQR